MPDWIINPYGIPYLAWVVFGVGLIICTAVGIAVGLAAAWRHREKRDGLR